MPTNYPSGLDNFTNPTPADNLNNPLVLHSDEHTNANDAIEALEKWVGVSGSSDAATIEYRVNHPPMSTSGLGVVVWTSGTFVATGTVLNFTGDAVSVSASGTVVQITITGSIGPMGPQGAIGPSGSPGSQGPIGPSGSPGNDGVQGPIGPSGSPGSNGLNFVGLMGWSDGITLGTGTVLNVRGSNAAFTLSGTTLDLFVTGVTYPPHPGDASHALETTAAGYAWSQGKLVLNTGSILTNSIPDLQFYKAVNLDYIQFEAPATVLTVSSGSNTTFQTKSQFFETAGYEIISMRPIQGTYSSQIYLINTSFTTRTWTFPDQNGTVALLTDISGVAVLPPGDIGVMGWNNGIPLGTGTVLNVNGSRLVMTISGATLNLGNSPDPMDNIGAWVQVTGVPLGTGTIFNFTGPGSVVSISGTTVQIQLTGTPGPQGPTGSQGPTGPSGSQGSIGPQGPSGSPGSTGPQGIQGVAGTPLLGMMGWNGGIPLGTGSTLNVVGSRLVASLSGSVLQITNSSDPAELIGVFGVNQGNNLGTGTTFSVTGSRLAMSLVGTTLNLTSSPDPVELIGVMGQSAGVPLGTGTTLNVRGTSFTFSISGTVLDLFVTGTPGVGVATDAIWSSKGQIAVASGAAAASVLTVGSDQKHLVADSSQALGVAWGQTYLSDNFNRADAATPGAPQVGDLPILYKGGGQGDWGITSNQLAPKSSQGENAVLWGVNAHRYKFTATMSTKPTDGGLLVRANSAGQWFLIHANTGTKYTLYKAVAGYTLLATGGTQTPTSGDVIAVTVTETRILVVVNGTTEIDYNTTPDAGLFDMNVLVGFRENNGTTARFDDMTVVEI